MSTNMGNLEKLGILVIVILVVVVGVVAITPKSTVDSQLMQQPEVASAAGDGVEPLDPATPGATDPAKPAVDPFPVVGADQTRLPANSLDPVAPPAETPSFRVVKAQANDTFATIAKRELTSAARFTEIAKLNPDLNGAKLKKGQDVKIPLAAPTPAPAPGGDPKSAASGGGSATPPAPASGGRTYTVKSGDTLMTIAQREMRSRNRWHELQTLNEDVLHGSTNLKIGMKLRLPGGDASSSSSSSSTASMDVPAPATTEATADREYVVKAGDSLWLIAKNQLGSEKYVSALREANSDVLKGGDALKVGMKLRLPSTK